MDFLYWLQNYRTPFWDQFFIFCNFLDRIEFFLILIPIVWVVYGWKWGLRLFYLMNISRTVSLLLKMVFAIPRPFVQDPSLALVHPGGYSFPSGGAQTGMLLALVIFSTWKTSLRWYVGAFFCLLISFSRLYLGVHVPYDILGGWVAGFFVWLIFYYIFPLIEKKLSAFRKEHLLIMGIVAPWAFLGIAPSFSILQASLGGSALAVGAYLTYDLKVKISPAKKLVSKLGQGFIAAVGCWLLSKPLSNYLSPWLVPVLSGLWISFVSFLCIRWLQKKQSK